MPWQRRWRVDSRETWQRIIAALREFEIDFARNPLEIIVREEYVDKSVEQRGLFHAVCEDAAAALGDRTPGEVKELAKQIYFGDDWRHHSTEDLTHEQYGMLIETLYRLLAGEGIVIPDRRQ